MLWNVTSEFEVFASFTHFNGELLSPVNNIGSPGQDIPRSPETAGQITLKYRFARESSLKGLRMGLTGTYKSSAPIKPNYSRPTIVSDAHFILNGFIRYRLPTKLNTEVFINANNILNEKYILPNNNYGALAAVNVGMQVRF